MTTYKNFRFTKVEIKSGDSDWMPLTGVQSIDVDWTPAPVDTGWRMLGTRLFHIEATGTVRMSRVLRVFKSARHTKIARRKIWRYMERVGL